MIFPPEGVEVDEIDLAEWWRIDQIMELEVETEGGTMRSILDRGMDRAERLHPFA